MRNNNVAIMNKSDSKPRPLPKPRARYRSSPSNPVDPIEISSHVSSSVPVNEPPPLLAKPKFNYRQLDFPIEKLVLLTAEIDIEETTSANTERSSRRSSDNVETNNNNVFIDCNKPSETGAVDGNYKVSQSSDGKYGKPAPPLPSTEEEVDKPPAKPPRLISNSSHLDGNEDVERQKSAILLETKKIVRKRYPPIPRKPTCLRTSVDEPRFSGTFHVEPDTDGSTGDAKIKPEVCSPLQNNMVDKSEKSGRLLMTKVSDVGRTPPLPKKPARLQQAPKAYKECIDGVDKTETIDENVNSRRKPSPPCQNGFSSNNGLSGVLGNVETDKDKDISLNAKGNENSSDNTVDKNISSKNSSRSKTRRPPPERPPPQFKDPPNKPLPRLPKQYSFEERRKFRAPPIPQSTRPVSVALREYASETKPIQRSLSSSDLVDTAVNTQDLLYSEAYAHFLNSGGNARNLSSKDDDTNDNGDYEPVDNVMVNEFMEARQQKLTSASDMSVTVDDVQENRKLTRLTSTTYSSSSGDSEHEYIEPISPMPEKRLNKVPSRTNTVSSGGSSNYVEAIHDSDIESSKSEKSELKVEENVTINMDDGVLEKKADINWTYEGENVDSSSDESYVEPEEDENDEALTEEPLYQVYQAAALEKERTLSLKRSKKSRDRTCTWRYGTLRDGKLLWSQLPDVRNSGLLENISSEERKYQEAIFEVITSEASYLKSLNLLVDHFLDSPIFSTDGADSILERHQVKELCSNIREILQVSERFLDDLRSRQRQSVKINSISDIVSNHANNYFDAYVAYCSTQYKQDRILTNLKQTNLRFAESLEKLERDSRVLGLSLQSFLVLPMQRVTRYPLLVDAIVRRCEPGHKEYYKIDAALKAVNVIVHKCNEGARREERKDEMTEIVKVITFRKINPIKLITEDRWLLRRGPIQLLEVEKKSTLSNTLRGRFKRYPVKPIYLFLFSDLLVVTKKKSESYSVIDYAKRSMIRILETTWKATNSFMLVLLENFEKKTKELSVRADNETDLTRWKEAFVPSSPSTEDEKIYGTWDCPQVNAIHNYQAQQSDELSLVPGDVVNVLRKLSDGWYEGERIRDSICGWFPANHTEEIRNEHVRARNLHQRYRLLAASTAFLDNKKR